MEGELQQTRSSMLAGRVEAVGCCFGLFVKIEWSSGSSLNPAEEAHTVCDDASFNTQPRNREQSP